MKKVFITSLIFGLVFVDFFLAPQARAAVAFIQATSSGVVDACCTTITTATFASNTTAGNIIIAAVWEDNGTAAPTGSISDTQGDAFTLAASTINSSGNLVAYLYYAPNIKGGADSVSFNWSGGAGARYNDLSISEYSGIAQTNPLDQINQSNGGGYPVSSIPTGNITTTAGNELLYSFAGFAAVSAGTASSAAGWTQRTQDNSNLNVYMYSADQMVSSTGSYSNTFTVPFSYGGTAYIAAFKAAVIGPPDATPPSAPTNLSATAVSPSQINLSWTASTDNVGVTGYKIFRNGSQIGSSASNSYADPGLTASTQYMYTVSAYDSAGNNSAQSTSASATTQAPSSGGNTFAAASCSQPDVNAVINGPIHTAIDGDTINIPAGSCTWASGVNVPNGIGISIIGAGQGNTTITSNVSGGNLFVMRPNYGNSSSRISSMTLLPYTGVRPGAPIIIIGTCTPSGCPNMRIDHLTLPSSWAGIGLSGDSVVVEDNMFGVLDHNIVGDVQSPTNGVDLVNVNNSAWGGVGQYGDNSWAQPDTLGTAQTLYIENNTFNYAFGSDTDTSDSYEDVGGGRIVCRFNRFNNVTTAGACGDHGTETTGRPRGGRQIEDYGNTLSCTNSTQGCAGAFGFRSGVGMVFENTITVSGGAWLNNLVNVTTEREWRPTAWPMCDGTAPYDMNDGAITAYTGTISSVGSGTISVSGSPWTAGAYSFSSSNPGNKYYVAYDETTGDIAGISGNTSATLTFSWIFDVLSGGTLTGNKFQTGDTFMVLGSTLYQAGTMTGTSGSQTLTDSTKNWATNQWAVDGDSYSVIDLATGSTYQIGSNTSNTLTYYIDPFPVWTWTTGDAYVILRASRCLDQPTASGGSLLSGIVPAMGATNEVTDPTYEFDDTFGTDTAPLHGVFSSQSQNLIANRNYYSESVSQTAQTSASSPFNGASGTGWGTLANRPITCTPGVGYWATDQGNWNQSGNGFGQGELFTCQASNNWTMYYSPFTYPYPLTASGLPNPSAGSGGGSIDGTGGPDTTPPAPPTGVSVN